MWLLICLTVIIVTYCNYRFCRKQKIIVQKYPFYKIRDDYRFLLAKDHENKELINRCGIIDHLISNMEKINFKFFVGATFEAIKPLIGSVVRKQYGRQPKELPGDLEKNDAELIRLLVRTGKKNSIRLKIFTTWLGSRFILSVMAFHKLNKAHPRLMKVIKVKKQQFETIQTYAELSQKNGSYRLAA